jgi:putative flippase GtrA
LGVTETKLADLPLNVGRDQSGHRAVLLQFVKFCLVGAVSTALNITLFRLFWSLGLGKNGSHVCAFSLAVTNGFFINRAWTFRRSSAGPIKQQYVMFVAVNLVGLVLAWVVMTLVGASILRQEAAHTLPRLLHSFLAHQADQIATAYSIGELAATPFCAVWNFAANRFWTFGGKSHLE